jgi:cysteine desulfurase
MELPHRPVRHATGRVELSPVLAAMGVPEKVGMGAIRFSLGRQTTDAEIDAVIDQLAGIAPLSA